MHVHPSGASAGRSPWHALALAAASAVLPGLAHWVAGRRRMALAIDALAVAVVGVLVFLALTTSRVEFLRLAVRPTWLIAVIAIALVLALAWVVLITGSYRVLGPARPRGVGRAGIMLGLAVVSVLAAAPPLAVARYAYLQHDLITNLFPNEPTDGVAAGDGGSGSPNPFAGRDRITILLLASDAGPDRTGTRTDSVVAASIDTRTGAVLLFSLPRNLEQVPMPPGPLRQAWPHGFPDLLNAVYDLVTSRPQLLAGARDRGAEAVKQVSSYVLGLPIDYYAMVDLEGFQRFVDALGGVTLTVTERLPIGGLTADGTRVPPIGYIEPGTQHMNGYTALWYARSRRDSTDYDRILRQRCLIGAMVRQAEPVTVLRRFQELTSATKRLASTDIPRSLLPDLVTLGEQIREAHSIRSVAFVPPLIDTADPNYARIRSLVRAALESPAASPSTTPGATPTPAPRHATRPSTTPRPRSTPVDVDATCGIG